MSSRPLARSSWRVLSTWVEACIILSLDTPALSQTQPQLLVRLPLSRSICDSCKFIAKASHCSVDTSRARIGVDLMNIAADALSMESMDPDVDINVNSGLELGVRQPRRSYQSHHCAYRSRALRHERSQRLEASTISESPTPTAHVCNDPVTVGVNNLRPVEMSRAL